MLHAARRVSRCHALLWCARCTTACAAITHGTAQQYSTAQHSAAQHSTAQHSTAQQADLVHGAVWAACKPVWLITFYVADWEDICSKLEDVSPEGLSFSDEPDRYSIQEMSDVWSTGCVLMELLTSLPAFSDNYVRRVNGSDYREGVLKLQGDWLNWHQAL